MFVAPFALTLALAAAEAPPAQQKVQAARAALRQAVAARAQKQIAVRRPVVLKQPAIGIDLPAPGGGATAPGVPSTLSAGGPADETVIKAAKLKTTDAAMLDFFRKRTPPAPARDKIAALVKKLTSKEATEADDAQAELTAIGHAAVPLLRTAANNVDEAEASARARQCLQNIEGSASASLVSNAARLLATRRPAGAAEVLIAYLPYAEDEATFEEVEAALVSVAVTKGKPDPALLKALKDKEAIRRGTAAQVLCTAGGAANHKHVRPLLKDRSMTVRLRAGLGLVGAFDPEAVPVLIELLNELPPNLSQQAEDYLTNLAGEWAVTGPKGHDRMSKHLRRQVWLAWWKATEGEKLLDEFKSRTSTDAERKKILALIEKLGGTDAEAREAATTDLITVGKKAAPLLRKVVYQNHARIAPFATKVLEAIEKDAPNPLPAAAPRLLGLRKPEGTAEALIAYVPFCESDEALGELVDILAAVGVTEGKGAEGLLKGLESDVPERRMAAVMALAKGRATDNLPAMRKLLSDKDPVVRMRAALGLVGMRERKAVPALIALLKDLPTDNVWEAEEALARLAGDNAPSAVVGSDEKSRALAVKAWSKWWDDNEKTVALVDVLQSRQRHLGYTTLCLPNEGAVAEYDKDRKERWRITGLSNPWDVQVVSNNRVLITEYSAMKVTERDLKGKIVWQKQLQVYPVSAQRLRNGNTFIMCNNVLLEVNRSGKEVLRIDRPGHDARSARKLPNGEIVLLTSNRNLIRFDAKGKEKSSALIAMYPQYNQNEILDNGNVLVPTGYNNQGVIEYDRKGKEVARITSVTSPMHATRLPNGNTLIVSQNNYQIYEVDKKGKVVGKEWTTNKYVFRARRR